MRRSPTGPPGTSSTGRRRLRRAGPAPPLYLKLIELLLKSRIFSLTAELIFPFFVGQAWGERRTIFWKLKEHQNYDLFFYVFNVCALFYIVSFVVKSPGAKNQ